MSGLFGGHVPPEPDGIIRIMMQAAADTRPEKIDLGVGIYRDSHGRTPVFDAVTRAERRLVDIQTTKAYVAMEGDPAFHDAMIDLVLGSCVPRDRIAAAATTGGTGAVRQVLELVRRVRPAASVWVPVPTWPNHVSILETLGIRCVPYRYHDRVTGSVDCAGMMTDLATVPAGDVVLLHGCCHNPTGADLSIADWARVADLLVARGAVPMIDLAYQGFGVGIAEDVAGLRGLLSRVPEALMALSGAKSFGLYRERVGCALAICDTAATRDRIQTTMAWLNRQAHTFPPDHGARVVTMILADPELRHSWETELNGMRDRVNGLRGAFADALRAETGSDRYHYLRSNRGMFSQLPLSPAQVARLREDHALYVIGDGRINIAGLRSDTLGPAARAIASVLR